MKNMMTLHQFTVALMVSMLTVVAVGVWSFPIPDEFRLWYCFGFTTVSACGIVAGLVVLFGKKR